MKAINVLKDMLSTHGGRIGFACCVLVVSFLLRNFIDSSILEWIGYAAGLFLVGYTIVFIIYAWIINPRKERKEDESRRGR